MSVLISIQIQTRNLIRPLNFRLALYRYHQVSAGGEVDFVHTNQEHVMGLYGDEK
jgi:hypothetical protein